MSRKMVRYTEGEIGKVRVVKDFLPPPDQLVLQPEKSPLTRRANGVLRTRRAALSRNGRGK